MVLSGVGTTRLIGVNAPEEGRCGGNAATRFTRRQLEGKRVKYELGKDSRDRWRRTLAYLRLGDVMHNLALVEEGYAKALTISPNVKYAGRFEAAEREAKQQDKGPLADCAQKREEKRQEDARKRARAKERAERAERAERLARQLRETERRAREQQREDRGDGDGAAGSGSSDRGSSDPGPRRKLRRGRRSDPEPTRRSREPQRDNDGEVRE